MLRMSCVNTPALTGKLCDRLGIGREGVEATCKRTPGPKWRDDGVVKTLVRRCLAFNGLVEDGDVGSLIKLGLGLRVDAGALLSQLRGPSILTASQKKRAWEWDGSAAHELRRKVDE